ncbi:MAG: membrane protein [Candidatus Sericytochromatia bacterium]|nr:MAG: membrane protein [Candidatus Sericytochromatia bacterium]
MLSKLIIGLIRIYQKFSFIYPPKCRFYPSCSNYTILAINKHGILKGLLKSSFRLCKCHPFHPGGYDPV